MIDVTDIILSLMALLASIAVSLVLPFLRMRLGSERAEAVKKAAELAVLAAEQLFGAGHGGEKLQFAKNYLESRGFTADEVAIEAAVAEYFGKGRAENGIR